MTTRTLPLVAHRPLSLSDSGPVRSLWLAVLLSACVMSACSSSGDKRSSSSPDDLQQAAINAGVELPSNEAARATLATARELDNGGFNDQAIALYERAREHDASIPGVSHRLGVLYDRTGNSSRAMSEYQRALAEEPGNADLRNNIGMYFYTRGDFRSAETYFTQALQIDGQNKRAWMNIGLARAQLRNDSGAMEAFTRVVSEPEARANLGLVQARQGRMDEAKANLRAAVAARADLDRPREVLAWLEAGGRGAMPGGN
jgi:Tfp pilus assembly protein PilF